jgi:hypothetical protein
MVGKRPLNSSNGIAVRKQAGPDGQQELGRSLLF